MLFTLCYQLSEKHNDGDGSSLNNEYGNIICQELLATIMNQMSEGVSEGKPEEGSTVHIIEEDFSVYTIENEENRFLGACLDNEPQFH